MGVRSSLAMTGPVDHIGKVLVRCGRSMCNEMAREGVQMGL